MSDYDIKKLAKYWIISMSLLMVSLMLPADANHFRFGHINWQLTDNPNGREVEFSVINAFTRTLYPSVTSVGQTFFENIANGDEVAGFGLRGTELFFGDSTFFGNGTNPGGLKYRVDNIDVANNLIFAHAINASRSDEKIVHTYNSKGIFMAEINDFDRTFSFNNFNRAYRVSTIVNLTLPNMSPVSTIAPVVTCPVGLCTFRIPVADGNGDVLSFRLSNSTEAADVRLFNNFTQPGQMDPEDVPPTQRGCNVSLCDELEVDNSGIVTWDTSEFDLGFYSTSITTIESRLGVGEIGKVMEDFLIKISETVPVNTAPKFVAPTPPNNSVFSITTGDTLTFDIKCKDRDQGDIVIISNSGLPVGATLTPAVPVGNPASGTFSFTPTSVQTVQIKFDCTDSLGLSAKPRSMTIIASLPKELTIVKTIYAQKETFEVEQNGIPLIADVTIIAEIFEDITTKSVVMKQAEVITCMKNMKGEMLRCTLSVPSTDPKVVRNCNEVSVGERTEMNTVLRGSVSNSEGMNTVASGSTVKTVEVHNEVFLCDLDNDNTFDKKVDVAIFTEIWEDLNRLPNSDPVEKKTIESFRCIMSLQTLTVESCQFQTGST